jgi:hypothetical protein
MNKTGFADAGSFPGSGLTIICSSSSAARNNTCGKLSLTKSEGLRTKTSFEHFVHTACPALLYSSSFEISKGVLQSLHLGPACHM